MPSIQELRTSIKNNVPSLGTWMQIPSSDIAEILSATNFYDWIVIDMEHGSFSRNDLSSIIRAISLNDKLPFVRIKTNNISSIKDVVDSGFSGYIIPMVETKEELINIKDQILYPPTGKRGVGFSRSNQYGINFEKEIKNKHYPFIVAMIETEIGIKNLEEILDNKFLDAILIGPYDLSASLGVCGEFESTVFKNAFNLIKNKCKKYNIPFGTHIVQPSNKKLKDEIDNGCTFIPFSLDSVMLSSFRPLIN